MEEPKIIILYPHGRRDENEFGEFVKGKNVCLVGPSAYMDGSKMGKEIDKFDLIVRMNLSCPVPERLKVDIGSRTDILYHVLFTEAHIKSAPDLFKPHTKEEVQSWADDGVQWVVAKMDFNVDRTRKFGPVIKGTIKWICIPKKKYQYLREVIGTYPNMGTIAIYHLLSLGAKSLHVYGCDFHTEGYYTGYGNFTAEQAKLGAGGKSHWGQTGGTKRIHNLDRQIEYIKSLTSLDKRLNLDKKLKSVLYGGGNEE